MSNSVNLVLSLNPNLCLCFPNHLTVQTCSSPLGGLEDLLFLQMRRGGGVDREVLYYLRKLRRAEQGGSHSVLLVLQEGGGQVLKCKRRVAA